MSRIEQIPIRRLLSGIAALAVLALMTASAGCTRYTDFDSFVSEPRPLVSSTEYVLEPPDVVRITSKRVREIHSHTEQIRPDGRLTLPLIGSVFVAGKTPEQVSRELQTMAREYYEDADVSVMVVGFNSKKIFVFGEVNGPGPYPYNGTNTILETLAYAQPNRLADVSRIQILRPGEDGETTHRMTINLNKMVKRGETELNSVLKEGDIIFVPPTGLAATGLALQQLLLPIQPASSVVAGGPDVYQETQRRPYRGSGTGTEE